MLYAKYNIVFTLISIAFCFCLGGQSDEKTINNENSINSDSIKNSLNYFDSLCYYDYELNLMFDCNYRKYKNCVQIARCEFNTCEFFMMVQNPSGVLDIYGIKIVGAGCFDSTELTNKYDKNLFFKHTFPEGFTREYCFYYNKPQKVKNQAAIQLVPYYHFFIENFELLKKYSLEKCTEIYIDPNTLVLSVRKNGEEAITNLCAVNDSMVISKVNRFLSIMDVEENMSTQNN